MQIPQKYGYVAATAAATIFVHQTAMSYFIIKARQKINLKYPALYASAVKDKDKDKEVTEDEAHEFNCIQRAHQNSLEQMPGAVALMALAGLQYPVSASVAGLAYIVGRALYFQGYSTGDVDKRLRGLPVYMGAYAFLLGCCGKWGIDTLQDA